jgi:hypothetical protein
MDFVRFQTWGVTGALIIAGQSAGAAASIADDAGFYELGQVRMEVVDESELTTYQSLEQGEQGEKSENHLNSELKELEVALDTIINMGRKVWSIVEANKPVVHFSALSASALPQGVRDWTDLENWSTPRTRVYRVVYENLYGIDVIDFTFRVVYTSGGSFNGRGRYLTNVTVVPVDLNVLWGFKFDARVNVPGVVNTASKASPNAGMQINLEWTIETALQHRQSTTSYFVKGDGSLTNLTR